MQEKNKTPFGAVIEWLDAHIDSALEQKPNDFQTGYIKGTINARNLCSSLVPLEKEELKKVYQSGQKNEKLNFDEWFNASYDYKEHEQISLDVETKTPTNFNEFSERLSGDNSSEIVNSIPKPKRYFVFFIYLILHFLIYAVLTAFYLITLQFNKLSRLPANAEETKNHFKDKLNL